jgi:hypothetical protein
MPAAQLHLTFGEMLGGLPGVPGRLAGAMAGDPTYVRLGAVFHDLPYYGNMALMAIRYGIKRPAEESYWGYKLHYDRPPEFLASFIANAASHPAPLSRTERLAIVGGFVSHVALDCALHPLVNWQARRDVAERGGHESHQHRIAEKFHSQFFHVDRFGDDVVGNPAMRSKTRVTKRFSLVRRAAEPALVALAIEAYRGFFGEGPDGRTWTSWVRSFAHFGALLSGPVARRTSRRQRTAEMRKRYFQSSQYDFHAFFDAACHRGARLATLAHDFFEAGDFAPEARRRFVAEAGVDDSLAEPAGRGLPALPEAPWTRASDGWPRAPPVR